MIMLKARFCCSDGHSLCSFYITQLPQGFQCIVDHLVGCGRDSNRLFSAVTIPVPSLIGHHNILLCSVGDKAYDLIRVLPFGCGHRNGPPTPTKAAGKAPTERQRLPSPTFTHFHLNRIGIGRATTIRRCLLRLGGDLLDKAVFGLGIA